MDIAGVDVEIDVIKEYPELEDLVVNPSTEDQSFNSSKYGFKSVKINAIKGEELDLTPSTEEQIATGVFSKVKVNPIESQKLSATPTTEEQVITGLFDTVVVNPIETEELYAIPSTEEQIKTGLFNTVVVSPIQGETLNLAPTEEQQNFEGVYLGVNINPIQVEEITTDLDFSSGEAIELTAQEGAYIKKATINKDANLSPGNIKSGVTVCGVAGDVADTSDADATSDDIVVGKTAYVANEKIQGTFKPLDTSDATATAEDIAEGKTAYVNGEKITGILEVTDHNMTFDGAYLTDMSALFRNFTGLKSISSLNISNVTNMTAAFRNCSSLVEIKQLDTSKVTNMTTTFMECSSLVEIPEMDTSNVTTLQQTFYKCTNLVKIPILDTSKISYSAGMNYMVGYCPNLSEESLNNILAMCINATSYPGTKTLLYVGLDSDQATRCQSLSNYQAFLDAGWTTGY